MSHQEQEEFNQQEYNKEMEEQLLAHGFEETREGSQIYDCSWNIAEKRIRVSLHNHSPINILFYHDANLKVIVKHNHSMDWIKEQAKFYLGIDLVKKEEKEPLKCTWENAWKERRKAYWFEATGYTQSRELGLNDPDSVEFISKQDAQKFRLIPALFNLIRFANEQFPAVEEDEGKLWYPFLTKEGNLTVRSKRAILNPFAFASAAAWGFFSKQGENAVLLEKVLTPTL